MNPPDSSIAVSIIVPIYNVAKYLKECLDSIERQSFKNIEVLLINDGSTDESEQIARIYVDKNKIFKLINRENGGLSAARNTGLDNATGEYVYFVDSDDFLKEDAIETLYKKAKENNLDQIRFVAYTFIDGTTEYKWVEKDAENRAYSYLGDYSGIITGLDFVERSYINGDIYPSCCLIFSKRSIIEKNHLRFFEGIIHEDILFNYQFTVLCDKVQVINMPLYYRRFRNDSLTQASNLKNRIKSFSIITQETDDYISKYPLIKKTASLQFNYYINTMLGLWKELPQNEQNSKEITEYFRMIKPITKKYKDIGTKSLPLLFFNPTLYLIIRKVKYLYKKIFLNDNA